jgi:uncharacterized protein (TIGR02145 family)
MKYALKLLMLLLSFLAGFSVAQDSGTFTDNRDGKEYKWVRIGDQIWMAENLQFAAPDRGGPTGQCPEVGVFIGTGDYAPEKNGYYYDWAIAMDFVEGYWPGTNYADASASHLIQNPHRGIAPEGWHIPTRNKLNQLVNFLGGSSTAAKKLAATDWFGTNESGFNANPGGEAYIS